MRLVRTACLLLAASTFAAPLDPYTWKNVFIGGGGFVPGIQFHPTAQGLAYARTDMGGAYRWNADSAMWEPLTDKFGSSDWNMYGIESIALDPHDPNLVYIAAGTYTNGWANNSSVLRSHDKGRTWNRVVVTNQMLFGGNEDGRSMGERMAVDPNNGSILFVGTRRAGLFKSTDSAKTWTKTTFPVSTTANNVGLGFVVFDPRTANPNKVTQTIYVGVAQIGSSLYRSTDGGTTWNTVPGAPADMMPHHAVLAGDGSMYFTYADGPGPNGMTKGKVWKLNTATDVWTDISPVANAGYGFAGLAVDAQHPQTVMTSSMDYWWPGDNQWRSTDGGKTWKELNANSTRSSAITPFLRWGSADDSKLGAGNWEGGLAIDPFDSDFVMYGTGATVWGTRNVTNLEKGTKVNWTPHVRGLEENAVLDLASPPSGADVISAMGDIGGFVHADIAVSPQGGMLNPYYVTQTSVDFAESAPTTIVRVGRGCSASLGSCGSVSVDGGKTWTTFGSAPGGARENGVVAISADGSAIVWSPEKTAAYVSTDKGASWTACGGLTGTDVWVVADRVNPKRFYAVVNGTLYASTDGAKTFSAKASGLSGGYAKAVYGLEGNLFLSGGNALYRSTDGGATFSKVGTTGAIDRHGFGKAATGKPHPALFVAGTIDNTYGIYRSDDIGASWVRVNDDLHNWGWVGQCIVGDPKVHGRFYLATNGRGIVVGDKASASKIAEKFLMGNYLARSGDKLSSSGPGIVLFDLSGRKRSTSVLHGSTSTLDLSKVAPGLYVARAGGESMTVSVTP